MGDPPAIPLRFPRERCGVSLQGAAISAGGASPARWHRTLAGLSFIGGLLFQPGWWCPPSLLLPTATTTPSAFGSNAGGFLRPEGWTRPHLPAPPRQHNPAPPRGIALRGMEPGRGAGGWQQPEPLVVPREGDGDASLPAGARLEGSPPALHCSFCSCSSSGSFLRVKKPSWGERKRMEGRVGDAELPVHPPRLNPPSHLPEAEADEGEEEQPPQDAAHQHPERDGHPLPLDDLKHHLWKHKEGPRGRKRGWGGPHTPS